MSEFENQEGFYGTGQTAPPKSHAGVTTFLLILVILLLGAVSLLSIWNIQLFHQLEAQREQSAPVTFSIDANASTAEAREQSSQADAVGRAAIGISGQDVPGIYQRVCHWPDGVYITAVTYGGAAKRAGLQPGDIITEFDGLKIRDTEHLRALLLERLPGELVQVGFYRDGLSDTVQLKLTSTEES